MLSKPSLPLLVLTFVVIVASEANNSTPELATIRICGRDFIRTVVRVCPDWQRRRRSLEEPENSSNEEEETQENGKGLADLLGFRTWKKSHHLTKRNVRMANRCCHHGCTIEELIESVCF